MLTRMASPPAHTAASQQRRFRQLFRLSGEAPALTLLRARQFLAENPDDAPLLLLLGMALVELGRHEEAERAIRRALALIPRRRQERVALAQLGHLHEEQRDFRRAVYWYRRGIAADRNHASCRIYLGVVLSRRGRLRESEAELRRATRCREGCIDEAYLNLGLVLRAQERFAEAAACLREAMRRDPRYRQARTAWRDVERCRRWQARPVKRRQR